MTNTRVAARLYSVTYIDTLCFKSILFIKVKGNRHIKKLI